MECPKCKTDNTEDSQFCKKCATPLPIDEDIQISHTKTLKTPIKELSRGTTFAGRYEIIEELGKGGMGKVYRVFDNKIEAEVALKLVRPDIAADKKTVERFKNELKLARDITHKNVCRMYDLNEEAGTHYITMEYVPGGDLKRFIRRSKQLGISTAIKIAKQICEGLIEAHKLGVVHRDLKPNNIMIDDDGSARIMDFGIARSLSAKGITGKGVMIGTPEYMSPEQVEGKEVDQRSDIYSLGIILYEMVTGRIPFEGDTPFTIGMKHKCEIAKDPKEFNVQITEDFNRMIMKCLEKAKDNRYQNTGEVLSALSLIEQGIPTTERTVQKSKPITSKEITVRFTPKKMFIPAALIAVLAITAFVIFRRPAVKLDPRRVVVSFFENQTGDESYNHLGQYAANMVADGLMQTGMLDVVPFDRVLHFIQAVRSDTTRPQKMPDIRQLARETGAGTEISGYFNLIDETLSFHVQIIDVDSGKSLFPIPIIRGSLEDKESIVQELREKISGNFASHFNVTTGRTYDYSPPLYAAYEEYQAGIDLFDTSYSQSIKHFENALGLDPNFLAPYIALQILYSNAGRYDEVKQIHAILNEKRDQLSPLSWHYLDAGIARMAGNLNELAYHYQEARKLDPRSWVLNFLVIFHSNDANQPGEVIKLWKKIREESFWKDESLSRRNRQSISNVAQAYHMFGQYRQELKVIRLGKENYQTPFYRDEARAMAALGKIKEVKSIIEKSRALSSSNIDPGRIMLIAARELREHGHFSVYKEIANQAIDLYKDRLREQDVTEGMRLEAAQALYLAERWDDAQLLFEELTKEFSNTLSWEATRRPPSDFITCKGYLGTIAARKGDREKALQLSDELKNMEHPYLWGGHTQWRARIAALLGEQEEAYKLLRESLIQGQGYGVALLRDMDFEPLRDYKPFQDLLKPKG